MKVSLLLLFPFFGSAGGFVVLRVPSCTLLTKVAESPKSIDDPTPKRVNTATPWPVKPGESLSAFIENELKWGKQVRTNFIQSEAAREAARLSRFSAFLEKELAWGEQVRLGLAQRELERERDIREAAEKFMEENRRHEHVIPT